MKKTITEVKEGDFKIMPEMTIDFEEKLFYIGVEFAGGRYPCQATFEEVFGGDTPEQKEEFANKIIKAKRIAINNGIDPDFHVIDSELEDVLFGGIYELA